MNKQEIIKAISERIKAENRKHRGAIPINADDMAAAKIYTMLQEEHLLYPPAAYKPTFAVILRRVLTFPFFAIITLIIAIIQWANWLINFIRFGGESIVYTAKSQRKRIYDIYKELDERF